MRAAFIRLHAFTECPMVVWDAIAEHADALFFLTHDAPESLVELARAHPKCREVRRWEHPWSNHHTLDCIGHWADEVTPRYVLTFDEDELPPVRLHDELARWLNDPKARTMSFHFVWCWGDLNTVLACRGYSLKEHVKAYKWERGLSKKGFTWQCRLRAYDQTVETYCPYPIRHLPVMTPALRSVREGRQEYAVWWKDDMPTMPYDPHMTFARWQTCIRGRDAQ